MDEGNAIAYIRMASFQTTSYRDLERIANWLVKEKEIKAFMLDLHFNRGGLLDPAIETADLFIDDGLIAWSRADPVHPSISRASTPGVCSNRRIRLPCQRRFGECQRDCRGRTSRQQARVSHW